MRKNTFTIISIIFLSIFLANCENSKPKIEKFVYEIENTKVEMKIENGMNFLYYEVPTKTDFIVSNIDINSLLVRGAGIRIVGGGKGILKTEINVPENYLESDTLNIKIKFEKNGKEFEHNFPVPLKAENQPRVFTH